MPHQLTSMRGILNTRVATAIIAPTSTSRIDDGPAEPQRRGAGDDDADQGDDEQQAVDGRVEDLAELADLPEAAGEVAVDPVGGPEPAEQPRGGGRIVASEQEVEEQRQTGQPQQGEQVGNGEDRRRL